MKNLQKKETIGIICPFNIFPPYFGGASRVFNLVKQLSNYFQIILICNDLTHLTFNQEDLVYYRCILEQRGVIIKIIKSITKLSQFFNPLMAIYILLAIKKYKIKVIILEFPWLGLMSLLICRITNTTFILDEHNFEFIRFKRMKRGNKFILHILKLYEHFLIKSASRVYCVSEVDRESIISSFKVPKEKIILVRNGVDGEEFYSSKIDKSTARKNLGLPSGSSIFLFHGKLDYMPNKEALQIIKDELVPRMKKLLPSALFIIAGDNPPIEISNDPMFVVTGIYPNLIELISACDVVICPLKTGGGTRIKILEAIFCGKPVVSTNIGAEGLEKNVFGEYLQITDDWNEFCNLMIQLATTPRSFENQPLIKLYEYDWRYIAREVVDDILSHIGKSNEDFT